MQCVRTVMLAAALTAPCAAFALDPAALPTGGTVASGAASLQQSANRLTVQQQSSRAILDWATFNIGSQASVNFSQPGASSVVLNRVAAGGGVSQIYGSLTANGQVFLVNPAGTLFARGAQVNVGGLVASSLDLSNENFLRGNYKFASSGGAGAIVNQGTLSAPGGYVALLAPQVRNEGVIAAQLGSVAIGAGNAVTLDIGATGLLSMQVDQAAIDALIDNKGLVQADGGVVYMSARAAGQLSSGVINNSGEIHAARVTEHDGVIRLEAGDIASSGTISADGATGGRIELASVDTTIVSGIVSAQGSEGRGGEVRLLGDKVGLFSAARVDASGETGGGSVLVGGNFQGKGPEANASMAYVAPRAAIHADARGRGDGGKVVVWSDDLTIFAGTLTAHGGPLGGNGGFAEVSGKHNLEFSPRQVDLKAPRGAPGALLFDPDNIIVANGGGATYPDVATFGAQSGTTQTIDPATLDTVGAPVFLQATNDITINNAISLTTPAAGLDAKAGNNITVNASITTTSGAISLSARDPGGTQTAGGTITLNAVLNSGGAPITLTNNASSNPILLSANVDSGAATVMFSDAVSLGAPVTVTGNGGVTFMNMVDGGQSLTINSIGPTVFAAPVGSVTPLASLTTDAGGTTSAVGVTTTGSQVYSDDLTAFGNYATTNSGFSANTLTLAGPVTLQTGSGAITTGAIDGANSLNINSSGATLVGGAIGGVTPLSSLTHIGSGAVMSFGGGSITTTGPQTYTKDLSVSASTTFTGTGITFGGLLDGAFPIVFNNPGTTSFLGAIGTFAQPASLSFSGVGTASIGAGSITTTGAQNYYNVLLTSPTTLTSTGAGAITFAGTIDGPQALTINTSGSTFFGGAIGGTTPLASLLTDAGGTTSIHGGSITTTTGPQTYNDSVSLGAATTLTGTGGGNITFAGALNGANSLSLNTSGLKTFSGAVGGSVALASLTTGAAGSTAINGGSVTTLGDQTYSGPLTASAGTTTLSTTSGGAIGFGGAVSAGTSSLVLAATGPISGTLPIAAGSLSASSIGGLTLGGGNSVGTLSGSNSGSGNFLFSNAGNLVVAGVSQTSGGNVSISASASGNTLATTGPITTTGNGNITLNSDGAMTIGANVIAGGAGTVGLFVGGADITLNHTGGTIASGTGTVTLSADKMALSGGAITTGAGGIMLQPAHVFTGVDLGSVVNSTPGVLELSNAELANVNTSGLLTIGGNFQTSQLKVSAPVATNPTGGGATLLANQTGGIFLGSVLTSGNGARPLTLASSNSVSEGPGGGIATSGLLTINAAGGIGLLGTNSIGSINASNSSSGAISVANTGPLTISGFTQSGTGGAISVTNNGFLTVAGPISGSTGGTTLTAQNAGQAVNAAINGGGGALSLVTTGASGDLTIAGNLTGLSTYSASSGRDYLQTSGTVTSTGASSINAGSNVLISTSNTASSLTVTAGGGATLGSLSVGSLNANAGGALSLGQGAISGTLVASGASIGESGALTVGGAASLNAGTGAITLTSANDFQGAVSITSGTTQLTDANALTLGILSTAALTVTSTGALGLGQGTISGNLVAASNGGAISQTGALTISGNASISAGSAGIALTNAANDFQGVVSITGGTTQLTDANALTLGTLSTGALTVTSTGALGLGQGTISGSLVAASNGGAISQTGGLTAAGNASISAGAAPITLTNVSNDFQGVVSITGGTTQLTDANALTLGTLSTGALTVTSSGALGLGQGAISGNLVAASNGGAISQAGALTVAGNASISAGAAPITLVSASNDFQGAVTLANSGSGNPVVITDANTLTFTNQVLGGSFTVNAATIVAHDTTNTGNQLWNGSVTFNSTESTNGGTFTVTGTTTLGNGLTVNAGSGNVTFQGSVNGTQALAVNTTGSTTFSGGVGSGVSVTVNGSAINSSTSTASSLGQSTTAESAVASVTAATLVTDTSSAGSASSVGFASSGGSTSSAGVAAATAAAAISGPAPAPLTAATSSELGTVRITASSGVSRETIRQIDQQIAQARAAMFSPALDQLTKDPSAADVPECSGSGSSVCVKQGKARKVAALAADADPKIDKRVAVLFGNDKYLAPIPGLQTPIHDVEEIGKVLKERLGYDVRIVKNASRQDIVNELNNLVTEVDEDDSVFVYYAGHGYQAEKEKGGGGYWIPVDANNNDASTWISNTAISKFLANMASRQVMLISDSCYSGTLAQEQKVRTSESTVFDRKEILRKRSVLVMSSGGNEPVADGGHENHSLFAYHLIRNLGQVEGDLVGGDIHQRVREAINKEYPQDPQYGAVLTAGHAEGGEYLIGKPR